MWSHRTILCPRPDSARSSAACALKRKSTWKVTFAVDGLSWHSHPFPQCITFEHILCIIWTPCLLFCLSFEVSRSQSLRREMFLKSEAKLLRPIPIVLYMTNLANNKWRGVDRTTGPSRTSLATPWLIAKEVLNRRATAGTTSTTRTEPRRQMKA